MKIKFFVARFFELGIFLFNSYFNYLTRGFTASVLAFNLLTCAFSLPICAFNLPTRTFNLATRAFSRLTRGFELVTRGFELVTREFKLVTCGFELVTRNPCFTFPYYLSFNTSINTSKSSNYFMILIVCLISSSEMNKANPLPALTSRSPLILLSNLFTAFEAEFEAILITNPGNISLEKGMSRSVTTFLLNLFNQEPKNPAD